MSSHIDFRTMPSNVPSLCIPRVFENIDENRIRRIFYDLNVGIIERVDIVPKKTEKGEKSNRVFIHFRHWFDNKNANTSRERLLNGMEIKIIYDDPWFWKVSAYRESNKPPQPVIRYDNPVEQKKPSIQFDSLEPDQKPNGDQRPRDNGDRRPRDNGDRRPRDNGDRRPRHNGDRRPTERSKEVREKHVNIIRQVENNRSPYSSPPRDNFRSKEVREKHVELSKQAAYTQRSHSPPPSMSQREEEMENQFVEKSYDNAKQNSHIREANNQKEPEDLPVVYDMDAINSSKKRRIVIIKNKPEVKAEETISTNDDTGGW
jgi:hypothetical protein